MPFVYLITFGLFVALFTREVIAPASGASCDKRWRLFSGIVNGLNIAVVVGGGLLFNRWIDKNSLLPLPALIGDVGASGIVFLTASFAAYWWHRLTHRSDTLWRTTHQLHHSPSRIETLTAFYVHPLDAFAAGLLNACIAYGLFGVSAYAAGLALLYVAIFNLIAHADLKTPWWLGFIVQRPEMHRIHHLRDSHRNNYGLPIWDLLFGTWRNPRAGTVECGFAPDKEYLIQQMLLMRDVKG